MGGAKAESAAAVCELPPSREGNGERGLPIFLKWRLHAEVKAFGNDFESASKR